MKAFTDQEIDDLANGTIARWKELSLAAMCFTVTADRYLNSVKAGVVVTGYSDSLSRDSIAQYKSDAISFFNASQQDEKASLRDGLDFYSWHDQRDAVEEFKSHLKVSM